MARGRTTKTKTSPSVPSVGAPLTSVGTTLRAKAKAEIRASIGSSNVNSVNDDAKQVGSQASTMPTQSAMPKQLSGVRTVTNQPRVLVGPVTTWLKRNRFGSGLCGSVR